MKSAWIQTFSGRQFFPLDPNPDDVCIEDIAHSLSNLCRYNGHCLRFYSVAEHSVYVCRAVPPWLQLVALLHDAAEAYLADVVRPVKPFLVGYEEVERRIHCAIAARFGFPPEIHSEVHRADMAVFADEKDQIMAPEPAPWVLPVPGLGTKIQCLPPEAAREMFLAEFERIRRVW